VCAGHPVQELLGGEGLGVEVVRRPGDGDEQLGVECHLAGSLVIDGDRLAREVDEELLARPVLLAHDDVDLSPKGPIQVGELAVAVTVRMVLAVLEPEQLQVTLFRRSSTWTYFQSGVGRTMPLGTTGGNSNCSSAWSSSSSGSGQDKPAASARMTWSDTVVTGMPSEALTWRRLSFSPKLSRMTSRILRMATRGLVNCCSSDGLSEEPAEQGLPRASCYEFLLSGCTKTSESVYGFDRNGCTEWLGIRKQEQASILEVAALLKGLCLVQVSRPNGIGTISTKLRIPS